MDWEEKICSGLISDGIIEADEKEIIRYGIHQGATLLINIFTLIFVCMIFKTIWYGIVFLFLFWPLRIYAGGYHANTETHCYILSTLSEVVFFGVCRTVEFKQSICAILLLFLSSMTILYFAPQDNINKLLEQQEYDVYKEKVKNILTVHGLVFVVSFCIDLQIIWQVVIMSQMLMVVLLVVGKVKWSFYLDKDNNTRFKKRGNYEITKKC